MAFLPNGNIIVLTSGADDELIFMNSAGKVLNRIKDIVSSQTENSQTSLDLAVDGLGNIYILSQRESAVFRFSPEGKFVDRFGNNEPFATPSSDAEFRGTVGAIAVDSQGRIYVTDFDGIKIFSNDGRFLQLVPEPPESGFIYDMVFNTKDELFISDGKQIFQVRIRVN
jgi:sugar lactone lactonase YvrE